MQHGTRIFHGPSPDGPVATVSVVVERGAFEAGITARGAALLQAWSAARLNYDAALAEPEDPAARAAFLAEWARETLCYRRGAIDYAAGRLEGPPARGAAVLTCGFHDPEVTRAALLLSLRFARDAGQAGAVPGEVLPLLESFWERSMGRHPDFQAGILIRAARARGVPARPFLPGTKYWLYGEGARGAVFFESMSRADSAIGAAIQQDKLLSKRMMAQFGLPVAPGLLVRGRADLAEVPTRVGFPCVTKPPAAGKSRGVTSQIADMAALQEGFDRAAEISGGPVLVERHFDGAEYRLLVFHGRFVGALRRARPFVVGDGVRSIRALVEDMNRARAASLVKARYLQPVAVDAVMEAQLAALGVSFDTVPEDGERVPVRSVRGRSAGGTSARERGPIHPRLIALVEELARATGLVGLGYDMITDDISKDPDEAGCAFLELNTTPALAAAVASGEWSEEEIGGALLGDGPGRIPTRLIVAPDGAAEPPEPAPGAAVVKGAWLRVAGHARQVRADVPWAAVAQALRMPEVTSLTIVATPDEIRRQGFPLERLSDVAIEGADLPAAWMEVARDIADRVGPA